MIHAVVFMPLIGAILAGLFCSIISHRVAQIITTAFLVTAAVFAAATFCEVTFSHHSYTVNLLNWMNIGDFKANWALKVDSLTAVMLVVVTSVSAVVHIYSIGYMAHDPHVPRFMSYLSLFTFFMLMLVTADNLIQLFLGWEGVGLCSYLLIGFWFKKPSANAAAMKAFVVNRVGDFGFALGIFTLFKLTGSVQFNEIFASLPQHQNEMITLFGHSYHALTVVCILLFIGSMGKSAQIGLHTWLPDAMEGPTPVSALIHAATMVTAGVFLVARCSPIFEYSDAALAMVTVVGAVTCIFAASIALTQNDIKRIIAYSTCSQLGYMFFACGVSAYSAGVFHLMTHAFFKALLFLGAGSVIHAVSNEQDIRRMGGIWKKIPVTYSMMWIGSLALMGIFPFAGYYSKDLILEAAYAAGTKTGMLAYGLGLLAAFCTAFYSLRLIILVFHGEFRNSEEVRHHIHESPFVMLLPLCILTVGAVLSGWVGQSLLHMVNAENSFWNGAIITQIGKHAALENIHHVPAWVPWSPLAAGIAGMALAYLFYKVKPEIPAALATNLRPIYLFLLNKWYFDELYDWVFVRPAKAIGRFLGKVIDACFIDGLGPNGAAFISQRLATVVSRMQTGYLYHYAFVMLVGLIGILTWYIINAY